MKPVLVLVGVLLLVLGLVAAGIGSYQYFQTPVTDSQGRTYRSVQCTGQLDYAILDGAVDENNLEIQGVVCKDLQEICRPKQTAGFWDFIYLKGSMTVNTVGGVRVGGPESIKLIGGAFGGDFDITACTSADKLRVTFNDDSGSPIEYAEVSVQ